MKHILFIIAVFVSLVSLGQREIKKENQTKTKRTYWDFNKSQIQSRGRYFTDEQGETTDNHGEWVYYDRFGEVEEVRNYYKGGLDGAVVLFYPNGQKRQEGFFKYNRQDSTYIEWYENGERKVEGEYKLDTPMGKWNYYYLDGRLKSVEEVQEGTNYLWEFFLPDSLHTQTISDGNGELTTYYSTGKVQEWYNYENGRKHGLFEEISI